MSAARSGSTGSKLGPTGRLSAWSARRPWFVVGAWVIALVAISGLSALTGDRLTTDITFSNEPDSQIARELLEEARGTEPMIERIVVRSDTYAVDDAEFQTLVGELVTAIQGRADLVDPASVANPFEQPDGPIVSPAGNTLLLPVLLRGKLDEATENVRELETVLEEFGEREAFTVLTAGFASVNAGFTEASEADLGAEFKALPVALIVLIAVFGAVVAALMPMVLAFLAIGMTFGLIALASQLYEMSFFVTNVMTMIGLAVGIDYALFVIARFREQRRRGQSTHEAIGVAGDTAARAVVFSGITVVVALLGMFVVPTSIFRSFAIGASAVVLVTIAQSVTLLPAVVSLLGDRINGLAIPFFGSNRDQDDERGFWAGAARFVMKYPWPMALGSAAVLVVMSIPYFDINLGASGVESLPEEQSVRQAFDILSEEFSGGLVQPAEIVIQAPDVNTPQARTAVDSLAAALQSDPRYQLVGQETLRADLAVIAVALPGEPTSDEAIDAMKHIRNDLVPAAFEGVTADVYVGGQTAGNSDFFDLVDRFTIWVFAFVLGFSFVLLTLIFRSLVVPVKSIIMNLLSVGASYGVVVAVFQWGWLAEPLGFTQVPSIEAWLPLFMFTILFGLSMDYHIFLLSRIRERFDETHDNAESVAFGLRRTANIITGAAAIMVAVFGGFALGELPMFQQIGVGLAVSVFLDATIVRTILVPSTMRLLGERNWWLPSWLEWLPDLRVEREPAPAPSAAGVASGGGS